MIIASSLRANSVFSQVCNPNLLHRALRRVVSARGARTAGVDGVLPSHIIQHGAGAYVAELSGALRTGRYNPGLARRFEVERGGKIRAVDISSTRDRIVASACALVLGEQMALVFSPSCYGYRAGSGADALLDDLTQAIASVGPVEAHLLSVDISDFFPSVDHQALDGSLAVYIPDPNFRRLVRKLVRMKTKTLAGAVLHHERGLPLGSPLAPSLANVFLHPVDDAFSKKQNDLGLQFYGRYADNFFILVRGGAAAVDAALDLLAREVSAIGLVCSAPEGGSLDLGAPVLGFHLARADRQAGWVARVSAKTKIRLGSRLAHFLNERPETVDEYCTAWLRYFEPAEDCATVLDGELSRLGFGTRASP